MMSRLLFEIFRVSLFESQAKPQPFEKILDQGDIINYKFFVSGEEYVYSMTLKTGDQYPINTYEAVFIKDKEESDHVANIGALHFYEVLATCSSIMELECKSKKVRHYWVDGAVDKKDKDPNDTRRSRIYDIYFSKKYGRSSVEKNGRFILIDMTKIFPELFDESDKTNQVDILVKHLVNISSKNPNIKMIKQSFQGNNEKFNVSTDELSNKVYGGLDLDIVIDNDIKHYNIEYTKFETEDVESKNEAFSDFESLIEFMQNNLYG